MEKLMNFLRFRKFKMKNNGVTEGVLYLSKRNKSVFTKFIFGEFIDSQTIK